MSVNLHFKAYISLLAPLSSCLVDYLPILYQCLDIQHEVLNLPGLLFRRTCGFHVRYLYCYLCLLRSHCSHLFPPSTLYVLIVNSTISYPDRLLLS